MLAYTIKRIGLGILILVGVMFAMYAAVFIVPGNPARAALGPRATQAMIDRLTREMGLDQPYVIQVYNFFVNVLSGNLGIDVMSNRPVAAEIWEVLPNTLILCVAGLGWATLLAIPLGCLAVLKRYGLAPDIRGKYPFQLSGGMTRRVLISTAVMEKPKLVIADEPTPGLHLEAATRVMGHFREMADDGAGVLLITHDLELALLTADRVIVLYGGRVVEETDAAAFQDERNLKHPYTKALFRSMPKNWKKDGEQLCDMGEILEDMRKEYGR